ncbi:PAS domain S-box protein [Methylotetracoccus oryzae]|uniref:PAS domain S-box protein n=1 Tax=Methylotetracoccus oryzae TaxID=1919059 RepID=UPI001119B674|nr:PAS domain S-box protein [Methylotetracoccus oryzae]
MTTEPTPPVPSNPPLHRQRKILSALAIGVLATVAVASASIWQLSRFAAEAAAIQHSYAIIAQVNALLATAIEVQTAIRGYVITADEHFLAPYQAAALRVDERLRETSALVADDPAQTQRATVLGQLFRERMSRAQAVRELRQRGGFEAARAYIAKGNGEANLTAIRAQVAAMCDAETTSLHRRLDRSSRNRNRAMLGVVAGSALSVLLAGLALVLIRRDFSGGRKANASLRAAEQQLRSVLNTMPAGVCAADLETGRIVFANDVACRMFGYRHDELIGMPPSRLIPPNEFDSVMPKLEQALRGETTIDECIPLARADGSVIRTDIRNATIKIEGRPCLLSLLTDITERMQVAAALRASEARAQRQLAELQAIYDSIPVGLCVLDRDLRFLRINRHLAEINGLPATEHANKSACELVPPLAPEFKELAERIFRTGERATDIEFSGSSAAAPGIERTLIEQWLPLCDSEGQVVAINVVAEDITERKRAEETLRRTAERLELAQWAARSGSWDWDIADDRFDWSRETFKLFGLDPQWDKAGFESWRRALHPDDRNAAEERVAAALRDGSLLDSEYRIVLPDGSVRWINALGRTTRDADGRAVRMAGLCIDITERKEAEAKRRASEEMLRFTLDHTQTGLWQWDVAHGTLEATAQNHRLFGLPDDGSQTSPDIYGALIHPEDRDRIGAAFAAALKGEGRYDAEYRIRRPDGEERWIHSIGSVSKDEREQLQLVGISRDITERKRNEEALLEADRRKDEFLATLAHELRNPLAPLSAALEIMRTAGDAAPTPSSLRDMMERQLTHLVRMVDDLLEVSRITRGKIELRMERVNLATAVDHALETSQPLIEGGNHKLTVSLPSEPLIVEADPVRLTQVIANLLNNAAKYMDQGGRIHVTAERSGDEAMLSVRDEGIGIAAENLPRVFELFGQIDRSLNRAQSGLGIGLALVRRLVEMHGGRVEARSEGLGQGSEFVVHLPLAAPVPNLAPPLAASPPGIPSPLRVVVVDDNRDAADTLAMLMTGLGSTVRVVYEGAAALEILPAFKPDMVLLDLGMPGMDGYEVARRIRQLPSEARIMLVAITGWGEDKDQQRTREAGFDHHLIKPVRLDALRELLTSLRSPAQSECPVP